MINQYPTFKNGGVIEVYNKLSKSEKEIIDNYREYRAGSITTKNALDNAMRFVIQWKNIFQKDYNKITLEDVRSFLALLNNSKMAEIYKSSNKVELKKFLKWLFKDWSMRFNNLEDIKCKNIRNEEKINSSTIISKEDIEKLVQTETNLNWKTFWITLYESGFRPIELRTLQWKNISFDVSGDLSEINIFATKTKKARVVYVKESTFFLKRLREEEEKQGNKPIYVFHNPTNLNKFIEKSTVSERLKKLSKKALGREVHPYILRHSRATELYKLAKQNKISKDVAIMFMGHSDDMSEVYTHLDKEQVKEMLTSQVYKLEDLPEEKKHNLEIQMELLTKSLDYFMKAFNKTNASDPKALVDALNTMKELQIKQGVKSRNEDNIGVRMLNG